MNLPTDARDLTASHQRRSVAAAQVLTGLTLTLACSVAMALMPPHVAKTEPADGGQLQGRTVIFHGYTLNLGAKDSVKVTDLTAKRELTATTKVQCKTVGKGDCPGCTQRKCQVIVTLPTTTAGHRYEVTVLRETITVTAAKTLGAVKGADPKPKPGKKARKPGPKPKVSAKSKASPKPKSKPKRKAK
ncbi:MAG: hypothetical protein KC502_01155 [Myxococcales bacterium]|nr:hypothetical protein [Myxococcales bacterium]